MRRSGKNKISADLPEAYYLQKIHRGLINKDLHPGLHSKLSESILDKKNCPFFILFLAEIDSSRFFAIYISARKCR